MEFINIDILSSICIFLDVKDILNLLISNKYNNQRCKSLIIWKGVFKRDFPGFELPTNFSLDCYKEIYRELNEIVNRLINLNKSDFSNPSFYFNLKRKNIRMIESIKTCIEIDENYVDKMYQVINRNSQIRIFVEYWKISININKYIGYSGNKTYHFKSNNIYSFIRKYQS